MTRTPLDLEAIRQRVDEVKAYANRTPHTFALSASIYMTEDLLEEIERLRSGITELHQRGVGHDLTPTVCAPVDVVWMYDYLRSLDDAWRSRLAKVTTP